ncbi:hypothetical protein D3C76_1094710 [compost metagenome]
MQFCRSAWNIQTAGQDAFVTQALLDAFAHHRPDMQQALADLGITTPRPLVGHHQFTDPQPVLVAQPEQFGGAGEIVRQHHIAGRCDPGLGFGGFDDETAAHRVIGLLEQFAGFTESRHGHGIGVVGQAFVTQQEIVLPVEGNVRNACQTQFAGFAQGVNTAVDGGGIDAVGPFAHQAHDAGAVRRMTDAGRRQGTVKANLHASHVRQKTLFEQLLSEGRGGAHRTDGMGTGRADANFEEIENTDSHAKACTSNGRGIAAIFVGQALCRRYCPPRSYVTNEIS